MDQRRHVRQLLEACVGLLQNTDEHDVHVHVSSTKENTLPDQTKAQEGVADDQSLAEAEEQPSGDDDTSTSAHTTVNITINNFVLANRSPVNIGPSYGNNYSFPEREKKLMLRLDEDLETLEGAAVEYFQYRQVILRSLYKMANLLEKVEPYDFFLQIIFACLLTSFVFFERVAYIAVYVVAIMFLRARDNIRKVKEKEKCLFGNMEAAIEQVNLDRIRLRKQEAITIEVVFENKKICSAEDSLSALVQKVLHNNGKYHEVIKEFRITAQNLHCPSKEDIIHCISQLRDKLANSE